MSLLQEIQAATSDPHFRLTDVLRKAKILAARLGHQAFKNWTDKELNGYKASDDLPSYRTLAHISSRGDFVGPFGSGMRNAPIPLLSLPQELAESLSKANIFQSVSALENIVTQANQSNQSVLKFFWSADCVVLLSCEIYEHMSCGQAWRDIPTSSLVAILDTVRNRLLDFVLEIEAEAPEAGEAEIGIQPVPDAVVNQIFNQCVLHQVNSKNYLPNAQLAGGFADTVQGNQTGGDIYEVD